MGRAATFTKGDAMETTPTPCADVLTRLQWIRANLQGKRETAVRSIAPERAVKDEK